jgi:hypothetical protein
MNKPGLRISLWCLLLMAGSVLAQNAEENKQAQPSGIDRYANRLGGSVRVRLQKGVQLKNARVGNIVTARLMQDIKVQGEMVLPKNSQFAGRVVEATSREAGDGITRLAFVFERAVLKDGKELPLYAALQGVIMPESDSGDGVAALQEMKLRKMELESIAGDGTANLSTETGQASYELYQTATRGLPTAASKHFNCREEQGWLWCGPTGHSPAGPARDIPGMQNVFLQAENTPQGPLGVLVSSKENIDLKGGIDLLVQLIPRP